MDNTYSIVSSLTKYMAEYIIRELENIGVQDLVVSHGAILIALHYSGALNYKDLSVKTNRSPQTMTTLIKKLQKENYVENKVDSNDKRNKVVALSTKGKTIIPFMMEISQELYNVQYRGFSDQEIAQFRNYVERINNNMENDKNEH